MYILLGSGVTDFFSLENKIQDVSKQNVFRRDDPLNGLLNPRNILTDLNKLVSKGCS